jgi:hypothetical protein
MKSQKDQPSKKEQPQLGELVALAFEEAQRLTPDPTRAAKLAADAVRRILLLGGDVRLMRLLATT